MTRLIAKLLAARLNWRRSTAAVLVIAAGMGLMLYTICAPVDVTDNPNYNGGYERNRVYTLLAPTLLMRSGDTYTLTRLPTNLVRADSRTEIPAGTRIRLVRISFFRGVTADNVVRTIPYGTLLDGPAPGVSVILSGVSTVSRSFPHVFVRDSALLAPTP